MDVKAFTLLLVLVLIETSHAQYYYPHELRGKYCEKRASLGMTPCCTSRQDDCSMPIHKTLCYCDEFCDRIQNSDCCPDYQRVCKSPANNTKPDNESCVEGNLVVRKHKSFMKNCNKCICTSSLKIECEEEKCLVENDLIEHINQCNNSLGWTARMYERFNGKKLYDGFNKRTGAKKPRKQVMGMSKIFNPHTKLPPCFYSIQEWTGLTEIKDQGWCASSWAMATAQVASDRFSLKSHNQDNIDFATQQILDCRPKEKGCHGGHVDHAWNYLNRVGGVPEECYPYTHRVNHCRVRKNDTLSSVGCGIGSLYHVGPAYSIRANESDIMWEIYNNGPVLAIMKVYPDFFSYSSGIYQHSKVDDSHLFSYHAVRIIGWGEENIGNLKKKFWVVANTWGSWWGEHGYFRIVRGVNECEIEEFVVAALPVIRKRRN